MAASTRSGWLAPMSGWLAPMFRVRQLLRTAARASLFAAAAVGAHIPAFSQSELETLGERERVLVERVENEQVANGPYSRELIGLLTTLSLFYEEVGDDTAADATTLQVLQVVRANFGLYSLEQAPAIRQLISRAQSRGNSVAAWELETELLRLAERHPGDPRTARIFLDTADRRKDVLERFEAGEIPPEIIIGCYYVDTEGTNEAWLRGPRPIFATDQGLSRQRCESGSRPVARQGLAGETQWYYDRAVQVILQNEGYASDALLRPLTELARSSYLYLNPPLGRSTHEHLVAYHTAHSESPLPGIEALVQSADWDLLQAQHLGTKFEKVAVQKYEQAYENLVSNDIAQATIEDIFSPDVPVMLPSYMSNRFVATTEPLTDYVDVSFVVTDDGKGERIEIVGSTPRVTRAEKREIVQLIKRSRFRPMLTDGRLTDSEARTVRYGLDD